MPAFPPPPPGRAPEVVPGRLPGDLPRPSGPEIVEDPEGPETWPGWHPPADEAPPEPDPRRRAPDPSGGGSTWLH